MCTKEYVISRLPRTMRTFGSLELVLLHSKPFLVFFRCRGGLEQACVLLLEAPGQELERRVLEAGSIAQ